MILNAVGDSIVNGYGVGKENSFVNIGDFFVNNYGVNGFTTKELLNSIENINYGDISVIYIGINDFFNRVSFTDVCNNLAEIVKCLKLKSKKVILCSVHEICAGDFFGMYEASIKAANEDIKNYRKFIIEVSEKENLIFLDYFTLLKNEDDYESLFFDGIHPIESTHEIMKKYLLEKVR